MTQTTDPRELVAGLFPTYGQFSHAQTTRAAAMIGELVRYLNYATAASEGLPYPATVYDLLGNLRQALAGLDQTLDQTAHAFGQMCGDRYAEVNNRHADDRWPGMDLTMTGLVLAAHLRDARSDVGDAARWIGDAQVYAGRLSIVDSDEEN